MAKSDKMESTNRSVIRIGPFTLRTVSFAIIIFLIYLILLFPTFQVFPNYSRSIYGNETIPPYFQGFLFFTPILLWTGFGILMIVYIALQMIMDYLDFKQRKK
jgi:hypothetical protein